MKTAIVLIALTLLGCTGLIPAKPHSKTDGEWGARLASVEVGDSITEVREKLGMLRFGVSLEDETTGFYASDMRFRDGRYFVGVFAPDQKLLRSLTMTNHPVSFYSMNKSVSGKSNGMLIFRAKRISRVLLVLQWNLSLFVSV